jgi:putative acetyltransferase
MAEANTDSQLVIRTYEPRDYGAVWSLHREGVMATTPEYLDVYAKYEDDLRDIENEYLGAGSNFWVAEAVGRLVGMAAIQRIDAETGRLRRMRVTVAWRRRGVARLLLETAERMCREQGYRRIVLDTTEQQTAAHRLYEAARFTRTGERSLGPFSVFFYEKALK